MRRLNQAPHYFRPEDHLYPLRTHDNYGFAVGRSAQEQLLWGQGDVDVIILRFDLEGRMAAQPERRAFSRRPQTADEMDRAFKDLSVELRQIHGAEDRPIHIRRFWLPALEAGIDDLPDTLGEFIKDPHSFDAHETSEYSAALQSWRSSDRFAFWWSAEFEIDGAGEVFAS
jgi:hypothetical protein